MKTKKLLAVLLSLAMLICLFPVSAGADADEVIELDLPQIVFDPDMVNPDKISVAYEGKMVRLYLTDGKFSIAANADFIERADVEVWIILSDNAELCGCALPACDNILNITLEARSCKISGGVYYMRIDCASTYGEITGGLFYGNVFERDRISGGIFVGASVLNPSTSVSGGIFIGNTVIDGRNLIHTVNYTGGIFANAPTSVSYSGATAAIENLYGFSINNGYVTGTEVLENVLTSGYTVSGAQVPITAYEPAEGMAFAGWTGEGVTFEDASAASTSFTMTAEEVTVTANYAPVKLPGDIDGDGKLTMTDAVVLIGAIINGRKDELYDYNEDGRVNYRDAVDYITWLCGTYPEIAPLDYFDMNGNGRIDPFDILIIILSFKSWCMQF